MPTRKQENDFISEIQSFISIDTDSLQNAIDFIGSEFEPEDVFSEKQLNDWAEANGYTKE